MDDRLSLKSNQETMMRSFRTIVTVDDPNHVVLPRLPFAPGDEVEVTVTATKSPASKVSNELRSLLKDTQRLPQIQKVTEEEIAAEVTAHRSKR